MTGAESICCIPAFKVICHRLLVFGRFLSINGCGGLLGHATHCYDRTNISMFEILEPGGSFGPIQHHRGLKSIESGYLNFTAKLT